MTLLPLLFTIYMTLFFVLLRFPIFFIFIIVFFISFGSLFSQKWWFPYNMMMMIKVFSLSSLLTRRVVLLFIAGLMLSVTWASRCRELVINKKFRYHQIQFQFHQVKMNHSRSLLIHSSSLHLGLLQISAIYWHH